MAADRDEAGSVISSTFSLGTAVEDQEGTDAKEKMRGIVEENETEDEKARGELAELVKGMKVSSSLSFSKSDEKGKPPTPASAHAHNREEPEEELKPLPLEECLFCPYVSPTLALSISHMNKAHGLFIPEQNYLVDLPGLIRHLGEKVSILYECLSCGKMKGGLEGVRTHMRDVGHCRIAYETMEDQVEIGDFYDFRSTYEDYDSNHPDYSEDEEVRAASAAGPPRGGRRRRRSSGGIPSNEKGKATDFQAEDDEGWEDDGGEGWETDSSASSLDSSDLCAVPLEHTHGSQDGKDHHSHAHGHHHPHHLHHKPHVHNPYHHPHRDHSTVYHTEYELHLPSGRTAGHRSLARYYRQNLSHPLSEQLARREQRALEQRRLLRGEESDGDDEQESEVSPRDLTRRERRDLFFGRMDQAEQSAVLGAEGRERGMTRAGELGMVGVSQYRRRTVRVLEKRGRREERRERVRMEAKVEKKGNMQKHYRDPLLQ